MNGLTRWLVASIVAASMSFGPPLALAGFVAAPAALQESSPVEILLTEYAFGPSDPVVAAGTVSLRIVNAGIRRHNVVVLIDGVEHVSPEVRPGNAIDWTLQIERPGSYLFWCGEYRHLEKGMTGTLTVE